MNRVYKPGNQLTFSCGYHHMDANGYYDGWTEHLVIVKPSLIHGIEIKITGRDRNGIKDYLADTYRYALNIVVDA